MISVARSRDPKFRSRRLGLEPAILGQLRRNSGLLYGHNSFRSRTIQKGRRMSHAYKLDDEVLHRGQGPQGRVHADVPKVYTIIQRMPVEADGRLRYRIKSDKIDRVVTEDELSYCQ
jgi:hypothetical protein